MKTSVKNSVKLVYPLEIGCAILVGVPILNYHTNVVVLDFEKPQCPHDPALNLTSQRLGFHRFLCPPTAVSTAVSNSMSGVLDNLKFLNKEMFGA